MGELNMNAYPCPTCGSPMLISIEPYSLGYKAVLKCERREKIHIVKLNGYGISADEAILDAWMAKSNLEFEKPVPFDTVVSKRSDEYVYSRAYLDIRGQNDTRKEVYMEIFNPNSENLSDDDYGKTWRLWANYPDDEEYAAAGWDD